MSPKAAKQWFTSYYHQAPLEVAMAYGYALEASLQLVLLGHSQETRGLPLVLLAIKEAPLILELPAAL